MKLLSIVLFFSFSLNVQAEQRGVASWYGSENKKSCTGKYINHKQSGCAHKTLPIGTKVKITCIKTNKSIIAVVEDRGPYKKGRIVDLNYTAARQLGILIKGIATVKVERIK